VTKPRVAVMIPTRMRAPEFRMALKSVRDTSSAYVIAYLDDDVDNSAYPEMGYIRIVGKRLGVVGALNVMARYVMENMPEIQLIAMMTDDSLMKSPGWDEMALRAAHRFSGGIGCVAPCTNKEGAHRVDQPAVTRGWLSYFGHFAHPDMNHYCWPSVIGLLADGICLRRCTSEEWYIHHDQKGGGDHHFDSDSRAFYRWIVAHMDQHREWLRNYIGFGVRHEDACRLS